MDYEKLHKDTINKLHQMVNSGKITVETACGICEDFIPESDDEKMKKIISDILLIDSDEIREILDANNVLMQDIDAWLEKKIKNNMGISEATKKKLEDNLNKALEKETPESWNKFLDEQYEQKALNFVEILKHYPRETKLYSPLYGKLWLAEVDEENEIITCYKYPLNEGCTRAILEQEDTVSFYSNGTTGLPDYTISKDCMLFLYDIEKQCEQKTVDEIVKDVCKDKASAVAFLKSAGIMNEKGELAEQYRQNEQNLSDKVETKFHVGDWITDNNSTFKIVRAENEWYYADDGDKICFDVAHQYYHLWNIKDAKNGDVLTTDTWTFIFKKYQGKSVFYHCAASTFNNFSISDTGEFDSNYVHPATEEQCDLLFQQMKEEGYTWDSEKKELKQIEPTSVWSEEDEEMVEGLANCLDELEKENGWNYVYVVGKSVELNKVRKWVKSLNERVHPQPNKEWSVNDERMYTAISIALSLKDAKGYLNLWHTTPEEANNWISKLVSSNRNQYHTIDPF